MAAGYAVGGISAGFWLVRWRTGGDVRAQGSGATGATNAGRALGGAGFAATLALDAGKGAAVAGAARWIEAPAPWAFAAALAVIVGHVWPAQLGFRGGKGIAPLLGAWLVLAPLALGPCLAIGFIALLVSRRFVLSGLCGLVGLPLATAWATHDSAAALAATAALGLMLYTHREHLRRRPRARPLSS